MGTIGKTHGVNSDRNPMESASQMNSMSDCGGPVRAPASASCERDVAAGPAIADAGGTTPAENVGVVTVVPSVVGDAVLATALAAIGSPATLSAASSVSAIGGRQ